MSNSAFKEPFFSYSL